MPVREPLITRADLPAFKELILSYQQWRKANGLEPSTFWETKLRAALEAEGIIEPRKAEVHQGTPRGEHTT